MSSVTWTLPLRTVSEGNSSEHWTKSSKRHRQQQFFVRRLFETHGMAIRVPCLVKLIRLGPRFLDKEDNLPMAFKWIKDEISECLFPEKRSTYLDRKGRVRSVKGRADDSPLVNWEYDQEKAPLLGVRVEIYEDERSEVPKAPGRIANG